MKNGFALLLSLIVTSILLVVGLGVSGIAFKEIQLSSFGNQSEIAFYAAETGLECGMYWDKAKPWSGSVTAATSTFVNDDGNPLTSEGGIKDPGSITNGCVNKNIDFNSSSCSSGSCLPDTVGFNLWLGSSLSDPCVDVEVKKDFSGRPQDDMNAITFITATGYNTCNDLDPRRVGRVLELELNLAAP